MKPCNPMGVPLSQKGGAELMVIGASAGGTEALLTILSGLRADMPPILIVQHMARGFGELFAAHLNRSSRLSVRIAADGEPAAAGCVYLAPDEKHLTVEKKDRAFVLRCTAGEKRGGHRPSVDVLFDSAAREAGSRAVGVLLTGMGRDGAAGLLQMREAGAWTIGQDAHTSMIYGMPRAAYELGAVMRQLPLERIGPELEKLVHNGMEHM